MIGILGDSLKGLTQVNSVRIDNHVFRLHYAFTTLIFLGASGVLITNQFFGDPIDCMSDGSAHREEAFKKTIDNFCWIGATYTVPELLSDRDRKIGINLIYEGIGQFDPQIHTQKFQLHYRWIFFLFFIQGILFYVPHYFWKMWESGRMEGIAKGLDVPVEPTLERDRRTTRVALLLDYLEAHDVNSHEWYTYRLYTCEVMNLLLVIGNFWFTNYLLDGQFWPSGSDIIKFKHGPRTRLAQLFPDHAKCLWRTFGPGGGIQDNDSVCVLPLNAFNRLIFKFLWLWYILLGIITLGWLGFRTMTIVLTPLRALLLRWKGGSITSTHLHHDGKNEDCIDFICKEYPHADWFVLYQLADNTDGIAYQSILEGLCERLSYRKGRNRRFSSCPDVVMADTKSQQGG